MFLITLSVLLNGLWLKPGSHLCNKHNTSDISTSISTRKKKHVPFFLCLCLCLCRLCYAYRTSVNQALADTGSVARRQKRSKGALNYGHSGHAKAIMENALVITTMCKGA